MLQVQACEEQLRQLELNSQHLMQLSAQVSMTHQMGSGCALRLASLHLYSLYSWQVYACLARCRLQVHSVVADMPSSLVATAK